MKDAALPAGSQRYSRTSDLIPSFLFYTQLRSTSAVAGHTCIVIAIIEGFNKKGKRVNNYQVKNRLAIIRSQFSH